MTVFMAILSALGALAGPFSEMMAALWRDAEGYFGGTSAATPDELAAEAIELATKAATLVADVKAQIAIVSQALQESHSEMSVATATHIATAAVTRAGTSSAFSS